MEYMEACFLLASFMLILKLFFMANLKLRFAFGVAMVFGFAFLMQRRPLIFKQFMAFLELFGEAMVFGFAFLMQRRSLIFKQFMAFLELFWSNFKDGFVRGVVKLKNMNVRLINWVLRIVWPYVAKAAGAKIKESLEPTLETYRPTGISQLKLNELFLGNVAPQIEGIRMQSLKKGQVTIDLDLRWGGDPSIVLGVYTMIGAVLPVQLKDFKFFATVRVIFVLSWKMPFISAIVVAVLPKPKPEIKYTFKVIGGSLTAVPGLKDMIKFLEEYIVTEHLQWPRRKIIPLSADLGVLSDLEPKLQGKVTCTVVKAESLKKINCIVPFGSKVELYVPPLRPISESETKVIDKTLNPIWNENFNLNVEDHETQELHFEVLQEGIGLFNTVGLASFPIAKLVPEQKQTFRLPLLPSLDNDLVRDSEDRGTLHVELLYHEYTKEECAKAMKLEEVERAEIERMHHEFILNTRKRDKLLKSGLMMAEGVLVSSAELVNGLVLGTKCLAEGSKLEAAEMLVEGVVRSATNLGLTLGLGVHSLVEVGKEVAVGRRQGSESTHRRDSSIIIPG